MVVMVVVQAEVDLTDTETTQEAPAARLPFMRENAWSHHHVTASMPPQVIEVTGGVVICNPKARSAGQNVDES
jgi:hypothetical protein